MTVPRRDEEIGLAIQPGRVEEGVPLHTFLSRAIAPKCGSSLGSPVFELTRLDSERAVYLCRELNTTSALVCKFFSARSNLPRRQCRALMEHEYRCLKLARIRGFNRAPFQVVRPLAKTPDLGCLLAEEYVDGFDMDFYIGRAAHDGQRENLKGKLSILAAFFAQLHRLTAKPSTPNLSRVCNDFRAILRILGTVESIPGRAIEELYHLCDKWEADREMWPARSSLVHGDATPTNFILGPERGVTAIDLERMHVGDGMLDIGLFAAELKHHFALRIHGAAAAEPYIAHFLRSYCRNVESLEETFASMTLRNRFYMALGELRIARNPWLPAGHRTWLVEEACRCLRR